MGRTVIAGRYGLGALIAKDRYGEVYEAVQERLSRKVSVRLLSSRLATPEVIERFLAKAGALSKIHHPNILFVSEFGVHEGRPFLVRDEIDDGTTLEQRLDREKKISPRDAMPILLQITHALDYAHQSDVLHLDLQPANILTSGGRLRLMDLGLVAILEDEPLPIDRSILHGSRYLSPEQSAGKEADQRSDLYSLGVIGYRLLTGRFPYKQAKRRAIPVAESLDDPTEAKSLPAIIDKLLMKDPADRFPTSDWVMNALHQTASEIEPAQEELDRTISSEAEVIQIPDIEGWEATSSSSATVAARPSNIPEIQSLPELDNWVLPSAPLASARRDIDAPEPSFWNRNRENVKIFAAALYLIAIAGTTFFSAIGLPDAASEVRGMIRRKQAAQVIPQLLRYAEKNPKLRAALGFAYVNAKDAKKGLVEYVEVAKQDPSALERSDIASIVYLIGVSDPITLEGEKLLLALGDRVKPKLKAAFEASSDPWYRCRAGDVLVKMGEEVDYVPACRASLESQNCATRKLAIQRLAELGDREARAEVEALAAIPTSTSSEDCGYSSARVARSTWTAAR